MTQRILRVAVPSYEVEFELMVPKQAVPFRFDSHLELPYVWFIVSDTEDELEVQKFLIIADDKAFGDEWEFIIGSAEWNGNGGRKAAVHLLCQDSPASVAEMQPKYTVNVD